MQKYTVGILRNYTYPDLGRQTSACTHEWNGVRFLLDEINEPCDVVVVLNDIPRETTVECREVWLILQEPPVSGYFNLLESYSHRYDRVYCPPCKGFQDNCSASHGALPWHVSVNYDQAKGLLKPDKTADLSWITSNKNIFPGHNDRLKFLQRLDNSGVLYDLYGYGFRALKDKLEGLAPYRYSLAVENYFGPDYWTEKIADCFLAWTMPIYCGCTNISEYFPKNSYVQIDIKKSSSIDLIRNVIASNFAEENAAAIAKARTLILEKYQLFPFVVDRINFHKDIKKRKLIPNQKTTSKTICKVIYNKISLLSDISHMVGSFYSERWRK